MTGLGFAMSNLYWYDLTLSNLKQLFRNTSACPCLDLTPPTFRYGFHMPRTHARDAYYKRIEDERASRQG